MENKERDRLLASIQRLNRLILILLFAIVFLVVYIEFKPKFNFFKHEKIETTPYIENVLTPEDSAWQEAMVDMWYAPDIDKVLDAKVRKQLDYGKDLIAHTAKYFGPNGSIRKSTNGLNCQNCHLDAGTKPWGNNYAAVKYGYPRYRPRSGAIESIEKRINDCFERSLNGLALDTSSPEMKAIKAYIQFLGSNTKKSDKPKGAGIYDLPLLKRAASPEKGRAIYDQKCASCHGADGQGQLNPDKIEYLYPPLWGPNAYSEGAGLFRLSRLAGYVRFNMPFGVTIDAPQLSNEEAWDIAAFVNSQPHPKKDLSKDWPNIEEKPMDHPFGPFADGFSERQHKYGPFQSIKVAKKKKK